MSDPLFVIESIYDGAQGYPYDEILAVAVCKVDLDEGTVETVLDETIRSDTKVVGRSKLEYAESKGLDVSDLYGGTPLSEVVERLRAVVNGGRVTSYDTEQQFSRYLLNDPWNLTTIVTVMPPISGRQPISLRCKHPEDEADIIVKAYRRTFRNDPLGVGRSRGAADLARMASEVAVSLHGRGKF